MRWLLALLPIFVASTLTASEAVPGAAGESVPMPGETAETMVAPASSEAEWIWLRNDFLEVGITPYRAAIAELRLPGEHPIPVPDFRGGKGKDTDTSVSLALLNGFNNRLDDTGRLAAGLSDTHSFVSGFNLPAAAGAEGGWDVAEVSDTRAVLTKTWQGMTYAMTYQLNAERPTVSATLRAHNTTAEMIDLRPIVVAPVTGIHQDDPAADAWQLRVVGHFGGEAGEFDNWSFPSPGAVTILNHPASDSQRMRPAEIDYIGIKSRFFTVLWKPQAMRYGMGAAETQPWDDFQIKEVAAVGFSQRKTPTVAAGQTQLQATYGGLELAADQVIELGWTLTAAGMKDKYLDHLNMVEKKVQYTDGFYRFFRILVVIMEGILSAFVLVVQNYGIAILLLTVLVKALLHKTMVKQQTSMLKMQQLGPEMKRIQNQYKGDRQTLAQKQMELFKKHGVNPMGGCLPILIQMPIFVALYQTFSHAAEMRGHSFLWVTDLTLPDHTIFTGIENLPFIGDLTINVLPILYIAVSWWAASAYKPPEGASEQQVQMAKMMKWIPIIFGLIFYSMPAGLVLYFTFSALLGSLEMRWIRKRLGITSGGGPKTDEAAEAN